VKETIALHTDAQPTTVGFTMPKMVPTSLLNNVSDGYDHSLKSFFERPLIVKRGTWSTSNIATTLLTSFKIPDAFLQLPLITSKVRGFLGFKGTAIVKLQVNTNRFQQGRLVMNYFPQTDSLSAKRAISTFHLMYITQLPRVDFDASTDSEVTFEIPYVNTDLMFNVRSGQGSSGQVQLYVYEPLAASSVELTADYTIWLSFKDVELKYPTIPSGFIAQAGFTATRRRKKALNPSDIEQETEREGPISSVLTTASNIVSSFNAIPMLSTYSAPTSWFLSCASKAAAAFGFSNPLNVRPQLVTVQQAMSRSINDSGLDNSINLGLNEDNSVAHLPGFAGTDVDELSLQHVLSVPTFFFRQVWSDSNVAGDQLVAFALCPDYFILNAGVNFPIVGGSPTTVYNPTPVGYFGKLFKYYRGSIKITIKVVKTEFHTGRMLIGYSPCYGTDPSHTNDDLNYVHREVLDLRYTNEITITLPYASTRPWLPIAQPYGNFYMNVLNDLRHPDSVSTSVTLLFEISCADDFEFSVPIPCQFAPVSYYQTTISGFAKPSQIETEGANTVLMTDESGEEFKAQAADDAPKQESHPAQLKSTGGPIGSSQLINDDGASALYCSGEKIYSLRQILKRANNFVKGAASPILTFNPAICLLANASQAYGTNWCPDNFTYINSCYAFYRGSIRIRIYNYDFTQGQLRLGFNPNLNNDVVAPSTLSSYQVGVGGDIDNHGNWPWVVNAQSTYPFVEVQLPYYSATHAAATQIVSTPILHPIDTLIDGNAPHNFLTVFSTTSTTSCRFTRQVGDDWSSGLFLGTSPIIAITAATYPGITRL